MITGTKPTTAARISHGVSSGWKRGCIGYNHLDLDGVCLKAPSYSRGICHDASRCTTWQSKCKWAVQVGIHWFGTFRTLAQAKRWAQLHARTGQTRGMVCR